jgi:fructokinase
MNRNYRVRVGSDDVVLRFYDRDARACDKEATLLTELSGRVAVPKVLYVGPANESARFTVLELVDGISMRDLKQTGDSGAIAEASHSVGLELAKLASLRLRDPSIVATDFAANPELLRGSNVNARLVDHFLESAVLRERLGEENAHRVRDFAWRHDDRLSATARSSAIAHGDFNSANILVRQAAGRWSVSAILDWEFAFVGSIFYDVGNFLRYERESMPRYEPWFSRGLTDGGIALPDDWHTLARVADMSALCELLARPAVRPVVADEVRDLVLATVLAADTSPTA